MYKEPERYQGSMRIDCVTCIISFTLAIKVVSFPIHVHVLCTLAMCTAYAYLNKPVNSLLECINKFYELKNT